MRKTYLLAAIGGAVLIAGLVWLVFLRGDGFETVQPEYGPAVEAVYATGTVEPIKIARIGTKIPGRLKQIFVQEGDPIVAGEVLAQLDDREAAAAVRELEARLTLATSDRDRILRLYRSGNVSTAARDKALSTYSSAESALDAAKARLEEHQLRAAISGVVLRAEGQLEVGDMMGGGQVMFVIGDPSRLWIEAEVDEEDIPVVAVGQRALIRADAFPGQVLEGHVAKITPFGDPVARSYRVHIGLGDETVLLSGMTTEVNIVVREEEKALLVPVAALAGDTLWLVEDGVARQRDVTVGAVGEGLVEIRSGITDQSIVIVSPPASLEDGDRVKGGGS